MERKLNSEARDASGKGGARKVRANGRIPAVVYGHGADPVHVSVDSRELFHTLHTEAGMNVLVDLQVDGEAVLAMPREVQRDHLRGRFIHVDFLRIARNEKISVEVPISLVGESHGIKEGGVLEHHLWDLQVECFPQDVPASIEADISPLGITESLKVEDIKVPDKLTVLTPMEETVVSIVTPQVLEVEEELPPELAEGEVAAEEGEEAGEAEETDSDSGSDEG